MIQSTTGYLLGVLGLHLRIVIGCCCRWEETLNVTWRCKLCKKLCWRLQFLDQYRLCHNSAFLSSSAICYHFSRPKPLSEEYYGACNTFSSIWSILPRLIASIPEQICMTQGTERGTWRVNVCSKMIDLNQPIIHSMKWGCCVHDEHYYTKPG